MPISGYAQDFENIKRDVIVFTQNVPALGKGTLSQKILSPCTVEGLKIRFYQGCQLNIQLDVYVSRSGKRFTRPLVDYVGNKYIAGDNELLEFKVAFPMESGDEICVDYESIDANFPYDFAVYCEIDYYMGFIRSDAVVGGVK